MKPTLLLDIDHTLLDNYKLRKATRQHLSQKLQRLQNLLWTGQIRKCAKILKPEILALAFILFGRPTNFLHRPDLKDSFLQPSSFRQALFPEVKETLRLLRGRAKMGTFSQGILPHLQKSKLYLSGIKENFQENLIFVLPPRKDQRLREVFAKTQKKKTFFVDNRADIVQSLAAQGAQAILLQREHTDFSDPPKNFTLIRSLKELEKLLMGDRMF